MKLKQVEAQLSGALYDGTLENRGVINRGYCPHCGTNHARQWIHWANEEAGFYVCFVDRRKLALVYSEGDGSDFEPYVPLDFMEEFELTEGTVLIAKRGIMKGLGKFGTKVVKATVVKITPIPPFVALEIQLAKIAM